MVTVTYVLAPPLKLRFAAVASGLVSPTFMASPPVCFGMAFQQLAQPLTHDGFAAPPHAKRRSALGHDAAGALSAPPVT